MTWRACTSPVSPPAAAGRVLSWDPAAAATKPRKRCGFFEEGPGSMMPPYVPKSFGLQEEGSVEPVFVCSSKGHWVSPAAGQLWKCSGGKDAYGALRGL